MDKKILKRLLIISSVGLLVAGIIFLYLNAWESREQLVFVCSVGMYSAF